LALTLAFLDEKELMEASNWNFDHNDQEVVNIILLDFLVTLMVDMDGN
jgi:hypothetical protein